MSARQPFIPQSKQSAASAADSSSDSLKADVSMSSDGGDRSSATSISLHSNASSDDIPPLGGINKPLNLANLGKKNKTNHLESSPFLPKARRSFEDDATRPFSPSAKPFKPNVNQRGMKIAAPSPFFPSSASFQPMSAFRAPRVPSPTKRHSAASIDDLNVNNPHTSTEGSLLGPDEEISMFNDTSAEGPRRLARSGTRGLENQPHQGQDTNENRSRGGPGGGADGFTYDDSASAFDDRYTKMPARRVQKRLERTEEIDIEVDYNAPKRYKSDVDQDVGFSFNQVPQRIITAFNVSAPA